MHGQGGPFDSVTVVAGPGVSTHGYQSWAYGRHYRTAWLAPIRVPFVHVSQYAGGLRPTAAGTNPEGLTLGLEAADGRTYEFQGVSPDVSGLLPDYAEQMISARGLRDQMTALLPGALLVTSALEEAVDGVPRSAVLAVLADAEGLDPYRDLFANQLGVFRRRPDEDA